eukprot:SAG22_NODE_1131_length_5456_cov_2.950719_2_plen_168_part_00
MPHSGRKAGRVWLPSSTPLFIGLPGHTTNLNGLNLLNHTRYTVSLWARSFPAGLTMAVAAGRFAVVPLIPTSPLGLAETEEFRHAPGLCPTSHTLNGSWTQIELELPAREWPGGSGGQTSLNLIVGPAVPMAADGGEPMDVRVAAPGSVWIDDVVVKAYNSTTGMPQ